MTEQNGVVVYNQETGEILPNEVVVQETKDYRIVKLADGSFKKNMKYQQYFSRVAETEEDQIELYKVFNDSESGLVTQFKNMIGKEITVQHVFTKPYQSFDEKTGIVTDGVTTTIQDVEGKYFTTSSKSVYYKINSIMQTFGYPSDENFKPLKVVVTGKKQQNGIQIDLQLIGRV